MLNYLHVNNYYSFISGHLTCYSPNTKETPKVLCVNGKNGSGKTQLLKALTFFEWFATNSFNLDPNEKIPLEFFKACDEETASFDICITLNGIKYNYSVELNKEKVLCEIISIFIKRKKLIFYRKEDQIFSPTPVEIINQLKNINIRSNVSIISLLRQYGINGIDNTYKILYDYFSNYFSNIPITYNDFYQKTPENILQNLLIKMNSDKSMLKFIEETLKLIDSFLLEIKLEKEPNGEFLPIFYYKFIERKFRFKDPNDPNIGTMMIIDYHNQSKGIQKLFIVLGLIYQQLLRGGTLILDDLEEYIHPHNLPLIFKFFKDPKINTKNAQLIFSNTNPQIKDILDKREIVVTVKRNSESRDCVMKSANALEHDEFRKYVNSKLKDISKEKVEELNLPKLWENIQKINN